jgi:hypothetical protein
LYVEEKTIDKNTELPKLIFGERIAPDVVDEAIGIFD